MDQLDTQGVVSSESYAFFILKKREDVLFFWGSAKRQRQIIIQESKPHEMSIPPAQLQYQEKNWNGKQEMETHLQIYDITLLHTVMIDKFFLGSI